MSSQKLSMACDGWNFLRKLIFHELIYLFKSRNILMMRFGNFIYLPRPPQKRPFFGGGLYHQIFFSILEIWSWFKIWKTLKVSSGSIWNILVNTWSTPIDLIRNEIWGFWKRCKKCTFSKIQNFQTLLI